MSIRLEINEDEPLGQFIIARAEVSGETPDAVAHQVIEEIFLSRIQALHEDFMRGEFSQGYLADLLKIERIDLIHLLEQLGLPSANV